jgi:hypothetical protein
MHIWQVNDASGLNGAFKIELTKAKRKYIKHRDIPKFDPTNVVPLTNMAFPKSFGNVDNAKKAIKAPGWNPLNYYLLTVLPGERKQELVDLTRPDNDENVPPLPCLPNLKPFPRHRKLLC